MKSSILRALIEAPSVRVEVAGAAFGLKRGSSYAAVKSGAIPAVKIGGRYCVPTSWIRERLGIEDPPKATRRSAPRPPSTPDAST